MDRYYNFDVKDVKRFAPGYQIGFEAYEIILDITDTILKNVTDMQPITVDSIRESLNYITLDLQPIFDSHDIPQRLPPAMTLTILQELGGNINIQQNVLNVLTLVLEHVIDYVIVQCVNHLTAIKKKRITAGVMAHVIDSNPDLNNLIQ